MRRGAFTIVEVLVVIAVIGALAAMLVPSMSSVMAITRRTLCANNLTQIATALQTHAAKQGISVKRSFPDKDSWPEIPQVVVPQPELYRCPEDDRAWTEEVDEKWYQLYTRVEDMLINFQEVPDYCRVVDKSDTYKCPWVPHTSGVLEYRFEAGGASSRDFNDVVFHVTKTTPKIASLCPDETTFRGVGTMSLMYRGEVVPGWEDFRNVKAGSHVIMKKARQSSYGINFFSEEILLMSRKVILLDYTHTVVELDADTDEKIEQSARHLGKLNVLFADNSVRPLWPEELRTTRHYDLWWP